MAGERSAGEKVGYAEAIEGLAADAMVVKAAGAMVEEAAGKGAEMVGDGATPVGMIHPAEQDSKSSEPAGLETACWVVAAAYLAAQGKAVEEE